MPVNSQQETLVPFDHIPPEIFGKIFLECLPLYHSCPQDPSSRREAPLLIGQICGRWRTIALSTPKFWSSLRVIWKESEMEVVVEMMKNWLSRSTSPVSLMIEESWSHAASRMSVEMAATAIRASGARIQELELAVCHPMTAHIIFANGLLPFLTSLNIRITTIPLQIPIDVMLHPRRTNLPWSQMVNFSAGENIECPLNFCMDILRHCPSLEICHFHSICHLKPLTLPVTHSRLRCLKLKSPSSESIIKVFDHLTLPALREMWLSTHARTELAPVLARSFASLVVRSSCRVVQVLLECTYRNPHQRIMEAHRFALSDVTHLSILIPTTEPLAIPLYAGLTMSDNPNRILSSNLRMISVEDNRAQASDEPTLLELIRSRWDPDPGRDVARLEGVHISVCRQPDAAFLQHMWDLRGQGLEIRVTNMQGLSWFLSASFEG